MERNITVAVDTMSGDFGPSIVIPAALKCIKNNPFVSLILVGDEAELRSLLRNQPSSPRISIVHAPDVVRMDDRPSHALRKKQQSSMAVALSLVRQKAAHACVSAGNTGALMLLARSILKTHPGVDRPAIVKRIPSPKNRCYVLDLGANVDCTAEHLYQFALMGSALVEALEGKPEPRVALLNVGEEEIKGNEQVRLASRMLAECESVNYIGYVEGGDIFKTIADVVVCDGFVGNVALKAGEGVVELMIGMVKSVFNRNWYSRLVGYAALPMLRKLRDLVDPSRHNGASLIGLQATVIKSHGNARETGFLSALEQAIFEAQKGVPEMINARLDELI
ncbi:phosphate acyltransferase PlsX [Hahella aquimaris]|uniref:phosphate acyltransferase PlsX n=1 Tax=Hahella sp. HNIBRBA332 TaxID=3015983 RepID=UPI00273C3DED|nr:phosphate acyltransferase PlsX [Hahella sp. HNIBRBA332]WLQ15279.1 phosphate acyltransferase PlsX [Hahella sp. HNIBRBA332]